MRIGILTFHCADNYGAVLQAYALQTYLKSKGHEALMINYCPVCITRQYRGFLWHKWLSKNPKKCLEKFWGELKICRSRHKRHCQFEHFRHLFLSLFPYSKKQDFSAFDLVLLGSDQIWNKGITGGKLDDIYWGITVNTNVASYAASSRGFQWDDAERNRIRQALSAMLAVSVREASLKTYLTDLSDKPIHQVLDPTLLVDAEAYVPLLKSAKQLSTPYVLIYQVVYDSSLGKMARELATYFGCEVVEIASSVDAFSTPGCKHIVTASPAEFVNYFKHARYVLTSSFHGTAFSLIFARQFCTVRLGTDVDDRALSLLRNLHLEERSISINDSPVLDKVNFTDVHSRLSVLRQESQAFLQHVFDEVLSRHAASKYESV